MRVSPLIQTLGSDDLAADVRRSCNSALAEHVLKRRTLGPQDVDNVVTYLCAAGEQERAALFLTWGISQLFNAIRIGEIDVIQARKLGLVRMFWRTAIPNEVSLNTRLLLRAQQIHLADVLSEDVTFLTTDLTRLFDGSGETEATGLVAAAGFAVPILAIIDFESSCRCLIKAARALPFATLPDGSQIGPPDLTQGSLLWMNLQGIRTKAHVLQWCDMIRDVPRGVRNQALSDPLSEVGTLLLFRILRAEEEKRPSMEQNWEQVLKDVNRIKENAKAMEANFLIAAASWSEILLLCERFRQADCAIAVAKEALAALSDDPRITFIICDAIGRNLSLLDGREGDAEEWLQRALAAAQTIPHCFQLELPKTLLGLACLEDKRGEQKQSVAFLNQAVELLVTSSRYSEIEFVKMLGDRAIAEWKNGEVSKAFQSLDDATPRLLGTRTDSTAWKAIFSLLGHTLGYMASYASFGSPPKNEDKTPYVLPPVGNFNNFKEKELASIYNPERDFVLPSLLAQFAQAVGRDDRVVYWADQMVESGRISSVSAGVVSTTMLGILPHLLVSGRIAEFFEHAREAVFTMSAMSNAFKKGTRDLLFDTLDIEAELGGRESEDWEDAEQRTLEYTLGLLAFHLGTLSVRSRDDDAVTYELKNKIAYVKSLCFEAAAISTRSADWREAVQLIEACLENNPVLEKIVARANAYSETQRALKLLGYVGGTMQNAVILNDACRLQMAALPFCLSYFLKQTGYRLLLLPFIETFWGWSVAHCRVCFTPPAVVESAFREALESPIEFRAKRIMHVIANGLGIRYERAVDDSFRQWDAQEEKAQQTGV